MEIEHLNNIKTQLNLKDIYRKLPPKEKQKPNQNIHCSPVHMECPPGQVIKQIKIEKI